MSKTKLSHQLESNKPAEDWRTSVLKSIAIAGETEAKITAIIGSRNNLTAILDMSNGSPRLTRTVIKRAVLILYQPSALAGFDRREIRCALCNSQITYPTWHYEVKYAVNQFHYFICFNADTSDKPSTKCYRRV